VISVASIMVPILSANATDIYECTTSPTLQAISVSNVRETPTTGNNIIGSLETGQTVVCLGTEIGQETTVFGEVSSTWYKVSFDNNQIGYVFAPLLRPTSQESDMVIPGDLFLSAYDASCELHAAEVTTNPASHSPSFSDVNNPSIIRGLSGERMGFDSDTYRFTGTTYPDGGEWVYTINASTSCGYLQMFVWGQFSEPQRYYAFVYGNDTGYNCNAGHCGQHGHTWWGWVSARELEFAIS
jgi:hypothetical protein